MAKTSKYQGVYFMTKNQKWMAKIYIDPKQIHIGYFDTEMEAHKAYLEAKERFRKINKNKTKN